MRIDAAATQPEFGGLCHVTVHRLVFRFSGWVRQEIDLDLDWRIGNDIGHVVAKVFLPTRHSA